MAAGRYPATPAITSFVHVDDAVAAAAQSLGWPDGVHNIVEDGPAHPSWRDAFHEPRG